MPSRHTHDRLYFLGHDHTPTRLALAEAAVQAASVSVQMRAKRIWLARKIFIEATSTMTPLWLNWQLLTSTLPNDAGVFELTGNIHRRQGKQEEATRSLERAIELDPAILSLCNSLRSVTIICGATRTKLEYWTARWPSSRRSRIPE